METSSGIYSIRLSGIEREQLKKKAKELDMKPSALIRQHILKLLSYGHKDSK